MQIIHMALRKGEGQKGVELLSTLKLDIEDYKLITSPTGDLLIINLLYGDTDILVDNFITYFDFENDDERNLVIFTPDTVIPRNKNKLKKAKFRATRESIITFAQQNSRINFEYLIMVAVSAVITSLGLILDNVAVIVGGMVIAPVLGPILAITVGIMLGNKKLIRKGISAEIMAIIIAVIIAFMLGSILPGIELNSSLKIRMEPTLADIIVALAAGAAAAYTLIRGKLKSGLIGVMVAAALLPVMCTIGLGLSFGSETMILGAFLLLAGNYLGLLLSNLLVFYFEGLKPRMWRRYKAKKLIKRSLIYIIIALLLLSLPLSLLSFYHFYIEKPEEIIKSVVREKLSFNWDYKIDKIDIKGRLIVVHVYSSEEIEEDILQEIKLDIYQELAKEYNILFKIIPVKEKII